MSKNLKIALGTFYLVILISFLYLLFSKFDISRINDFSYYKMVQAEIDEIIGQQIPLFFFELSLINILLSFIFFRFFDILKIFPASYIDKKYSNNLGIILDDIVAGIQASVIMLFITLLL